MMRRLDLSALARRELLEIEFFSTRNFGEKQTDNYFTFIDKQLDQIAQFPDTGRHSPVAGGGAHVIRCKSHYIYYEFDDSSVSILRIIHTSRDQKKAYRAAND